MFVSDITITLEIGGLCTGSMLSPEYLATVT